MNAWGNVAMGASIPTTSTNQRLWVAGNTRVDGVLTVNTNGTLPASNYKLYVGGGDAGIEGVLTVNTNGVMPPTGYKMLVEGKAAINGLLAAREVRVTNATTWPDYVFKSDYKLSTLDEVEQHIVEKGHLPGIPTEAEVKENGINLGEMQAKLLEKIEELTLYSIEQQKIIKAMQERLNTLESQTNNK